MRSVTKLIAGLALALLLATGVQASDLNEVGAFLVYPAVVAVEGVNSEWETFISITNAINEDFDVHVSYINGDSQSVEYCWECDFTIPLTPNDTELLVVTFTDFGIEIQSEDETVAQSCPHPFGFITVSLQDPDTGLTVTDNALLGSEVVVNYTRGYAYSVPAIPFQGLGAGDGDRDFEFDDAEYSQIPRFISADFIAPDAVQTVGGPKIFADLVLFTLGFDRQHPPEVDCSVTGYDAAENPFSRSFIFGCWTMADLCTVHPEFCYPSLGQLPNQRDTHGWLFLDCRVDVEDNGSFDGFGGVHGAIIQRGKTGGVIRRNTPGAPALQGNVAWARLLFQSVSTGDEFTLHLESAPGGLGL
jgi:hypothetical protein